VVSKVPKLKVVANLKNVFDGTFVKLKEVTQFRSNKLSVISVPPNNLHLETDGESLGISPLDFEVLQQAIKIMVPNN
jgi:diacylglycerol kinase family enzyme